MKKQLRGKSAVLVAVIVVITTTLVGGTATVLASDKSKPGDALYAVDRAAETVRGALTFGDEAKTTLKFEQATERLNELEAVRAEGATKDARDEAADNYGQAISEAASALSTVAKNGGNVDEALATLVAEATSTHLDVLARVYERVPEQAKPAIERAMEKSERGSQRSLDALNGNVDETEKQHIEEKIHQSQEVRGMPHDMPAQSKGVERSQSAASSRLEARGHQ